MLLEARAVPAFYKNGFLLGCEETRDAVIIDPGDEIDELLGLVSDHGLRVRHLLLTHAHIDHLSGMARAKSATGAPVWLHPGDAPLYDNALQQAGFFGLRIDPPPPVDRWYEDAVVVPFGRYELRSHHTPGHSPGGVCLQVGRAGEVGRMLFVGDTLFQGSIGRTDLPGGDYATLMRSIKTVLFAFDDEAEVYPGHGDKTTIGAERRHNPFLAE
jgi:glyoxylase-like metal-dependent hydrolase (beta-lactamase superfamily II)